MVNYTSLNFTTVSYTTLNYTTGNYTTLNYTTVNYTTLSMLKDLSPCHISSRFCGFTVECTKNTLLSDLSTTEIELGSHW